jgi:hypothetical protein
MPRPHIPAKLRRLVINRAGGQCEYCLIHQDDRPETHPIDHVIALKHGGRTVKENLALRVGLIRYEAWRIPRAPGDTSPGFVSAAVVSDEFGYEDSISRIARLLDQWTERVN